MGRAPRNSMCIRVYHVLNRGNARGQIFEDAADYDAFQRILLEGLKGYDSRLVAWCLMPNHWHLVLWPRRDGELSDFMGWVTLTHTQRWHAHRHSRGYGHVYQGRFKSFVVQEDGHYLMVCRYVERNALRANLIGRAQDWRWSSLWGGNGSGGVLRPVEGPVARPADWVESCNTPQTASELEQVRQCVRRGRPLGEEDWQRRVCRELGLEMTLRPLGRPRKGRSTAGSPAIGS
jgi:putative transposase